VSGLAVARRERRLLAALVLVPALVAMLFAFSAVSLMLMIGASVLIGTLAGWFPAARAARLRRLVEPLFLLGAAVF